MKATRKPKQKQKHDLLVGTWTSAYEDCGEIEFTITRSGDSYEVQACDGYDGEKPDIFETAWDGTRLSFAAHWNSTGRFARYRLLLMSNNRIDMTYTYTDTEVYRRKRAKGND